jgi:hypothetical protein
VEGFDTIATALASGNHVVTICALVVIYKTHAALGEIKASLELIRVLVEHRHGS